MCWPQSGPVSPGCAMCSRMAAMRVKSYGRHSSAWESGRSKSSSVPTKPRVSRCYPADGLSSEPSHGSGVADGSPKIGKGPSPHRRPGLSSLQSACSRAEPQGTVKFDELLNRTLSTGASTMRHAKNHSVIALSGRTKCEWGSTETFNRSPYLGNITFRPSALRCRSISKTRARKISIAV
jgi:hypothetical protein